MAQIKICYITKTLQNGSPHYAEVVCLQRTINNWRTGAGYGVPKLALDGDFGIITEGAVREFQRWYYLHIDGVVGPITRSWLQQFIPTSSSGTGPI